MLRRSVGFIGLMGALAGCGPSYDTILRHGTVYDGTGAAPITADVAIKGDTVAAIGDLSKARGKVEIDVTGLAVTPGFINMLSWSTETLIEDGKSQGEIRQGVTLEIMGEGESMGPWSDSLKAYNKANQGDIKYDIQWTTLREYLDFLQRKGIATNVGSFVGATTIRENVIGFDDRPPTAPELDSMRALVKQAMEEGAFGVGSSLIYAPAFYASTDELVEAVDELIQISARAGIPAEIYHIKAAGNANWPKMDEVIQKVDSARAAGHRITADMYTYPAGATGLDASMPPWVQEGGLPEWIKRLKDPAIRAKVAREMKTPTDKWESLYLAAGSPDRILLVAFKEDSLKPLTGKTLAEVAKMRGKSPEETAMDLVIEDDSRVGTVYFLMSEDNIRKEVVLPWVSFGSDAESEAPEGVFLKSNPHPRAYGNFARVLAKYTRDEKLMPMAEAIRKLSGLPAANLGLKHRGNLKPGYFADIAVFDPAKIQDHATFDKPHQYATGMVHVFVNGSQVLKDGEHTGALPGRVVVRGK